MFSATVLDWVPFRTSLAQVGQFSVGWLVGVSYSPSSQMLHKVLLPIGVMFVCSQNCSKSVLVQLQWLSVAWPTGAATSLLA